MKKVCCDAMYTAMVTRELEWGSDEEGLIVGRWTRWGFLPLWWCPYCKRLIYRT